MFRRQLDARVYLLMSREAGGVNESLPALRAPVELPRSVRLLVLLQVGQPNKGLLADVARVTLFVGVHVLVPGQAGAVAEAFLAHAAGVRALFVREAQPLLALALLAQGVVVGLVARAQLQADLQVRGFVELVFALRVRVEQLSHVCHLVLGEVGGVAEDHVALRALVLLLSFS